MNKGQTAFVTKDLMLRAVKDSFVKLAPQTRLRNPAMFLVYVSAVLTTALHVCSLFGIADARCAPPSRRRPPTKSPPPSARTNPSRSTS